MAEKKTAEKKAPAKASSKKNNKKPGGFKRIWNYLRECKGEIKKITWPSPKQTTKNFFIVLGVIVVAGVFIFALDSGLYALLGLVMKF